MLASLGQLCIIDVPTLSTLLLTITSQTGHKASQKGGVSDDGRGEKDAEEDDSAKSLEMPEVVVPSSFPSGMTTQQQENAKQKIQQRQKAVEQKAKETKVTYNRKIPKVKGFIATYLPDRVHKKDGFPDRYMSAFSLIEYIGWGPVRACPPPPTPFPPVCLFVGHTVLPCS